MNFSPQEGGIKIFFVKIWWRGLIILHLKRSD
jgi:hypothetical protein